MSGFRLVKPSTLNHGYAYYSAGGACKTKGGFEGLAGPSWLMTVYMAGLEELEEGFAACLVIVIFGLLGGDIAKCFRLLQYLNEALS